MTSLLTRPRVLGHRVRVVLVAGVLLGLTGVPRSLTPEDHLVELLLSQRFASGRFTGQQAWHPCTQLDTAARVPGGRCGPEIRDGTRAFDRIAQAARAAGPALRSGSSRAALRARALLDLRHSHAAPAGVGRAISDLQKALQTAQDSAAALNDLAVAYLEQGHAEQQLTPMLRALDAIEHAAALNSSDPAILFNRALILQRLYLLSGARRAWNRYLAVERDRRWRREGERYVLQLMRMIDTVAWEQWLDSPPVRTDQALRARIAARVAQSPQAAREFGFPLLAAWGTAFQRGEAGRAARLLALAREIGAAAGSQGLDQSVRAAVQAIDAGAGDARVTAELARGHVGLQRGILLQSRQAYDSAVAVLDSAEGALRAGGSPTVRWARFFRAASEINRQQYEAGDRILRQLLAQAQPEEPALSGKAIWALGVSAIRRGSFAAANQHYARAAPYVARSREAENTGAISFLLAEGLSRAGQSMHGRSEAYRALRLLSPFPRSRYLNNHLDLVASYARSDGLPFAALAVTNELVDAAATLDRPGVLALALAARMRDRVAAGRRELARADMDEAGRLAARVPPGRGGDRIRAHVYLALGQLTRVESPRRSLPFLSAAVRIYQDLAPDDVYLPSALYEAALAARSIGDDTRARRWLQQAVGQIENQQTSLMTAETRATFYETAENVIDAAIQLEVDAGRFETAFSVLERGRVNAWSAASPGGAAAVAHTRWELDRLASSLAPDMLVVEYAVLPDLIVIWTASRQGSRHYVVPVARDSVAALAARFTREVADPTAGAAGAAAQLFDLLLRPLSRELGSARELTVVPDRELSRIPFAALWDREGGRYVIERHGVRTVPSASFFATASRARHGTRRVHRPLVVGNPASSPAFAAALPRLAGAGREARAIAELYRGRTLLEGERASRGRLLQQLPSHDVLHFAGHAVFNPEQPELSYLVLAPDRAGEPGILHAWEIAAMGPSNLEVVVLSACSSLSPRTTRIGAIAGLAYSFLRAGTPATVSTLWEIDDGASVELLVAFHRHLASGVPAAEALRLSQLDALRSDSPALRAPRAWAAFIYTGP